MVIDVLKSEDAAVRKEYFAHAQPLKSSAPLEESKAIFTLALELVPEQEKRTFNSWYLSEN